MLNKSNHKYSGHTTVHYSSEIYDNTSLSLELNSEKGYEHEEEDAFVIETTAMNVGKTYTGADKAEINYT